jgi:phosphomannomutase
VIAFSVRHLKAQAGIVVTASHNPRGDSGFKVYDEQGIQIVAPWDTEIAAHFRESPAAASILRVESGIEPLKEAVVEAYVHMVQATAKKWVPDEGWRGRSNPRVAYTALHGVGASLFERILKGLGSVELFSVKEQQEPDGTFPTVPFPNPEEPGALDLLLHLAQKEKCDAAFAHDPDADRFALCLPGGGETLTPLSGDAVALLFLDTLFEQSMIGPRGCTWVSGHSSTSGFCSCS